MTAVAKKFKIKETEVSKIDKKMRKFGAPLTQAAGVLSFAYACHWQMNVVKVKRDG